MKNTTLFALVGVVLLLVIAGFVLASNKGSANGNAIISNENAQQITIGEQNLNYYPSTINVKANQPVEITLDNSVKGCLRSFNIKDLKVSKYAKTPEDKITFVPTKKGTFAFACSMGMGYGTIIVE